MNSRHCLRTFVGLAIALAGITAPAGANERHFTYTYESATLPQGQRELEFWTTWRAGRENFYSRFEHRAEFEFGVTDRLMTSLYINWRKTSKQDPANGDQTITESEFQGFSSEWKYKLLDPVADAVGLALYQEYKVESDEFEWESKIILDKKIGSWLMAYNLTVEPEWTFGPGNRSYEIATENTLGLTRFWTSAFSAGLELRNHNLSTKNSTGFEHSALFLGPTISYAHKSWWIAASVLPQLPALKKSLANPQNKYVIDELEKVNVRVIASIRF